MTASLQHPALTRLLITCLVSFVAVGGVWAATNTHSSAESVQPTEISNLGVDANGNYDARLHNPNRVYTVTVRDGRKISGPATIRVKLGDTVRIQLKALGTDEANVSFPDFAIDSESDPSDNTPGSLLFVADKTGTFKYYLVDEHDKNKQTELGTVVISK